MAIGDNIKKLREIHDLSQKDLALIAGVTDKAVSTWEMGLKAPRMGTIQKIADHFGLQKSNIIEDNGLDEIKTQIKKSSPLRSITDLIPGNMVNIPIIGKISCGNGVLAYNEIEGYEPTPIDWLNGGDYFYTRAKGDSMINARIYSGDLVLIRKQPDVDDGEIAAIAIDDEIFLKRVYKRNGSVILQSENPKYPPIIADVKSHNCMIVGKLKKIIINM